MSYDLDQEQGELYSVGSSSDVYEWVTGEFVLPLAEEPPTDSTELAEWSPVKVVRGHAPHRIRTVKFRYAKQMSPPKLPKPTTAGPFTFVGGAIDIPAPTPNINGGFEWEASGALTFVSTVYTSDDDGYILAGVPFIYPNQSQVVGNLSSAPLDVQQAGIGAKAGWTLSQTINFTDPYYTYNEPNYLPGNFFTSDVITGPDSYPSFQ